MFYLSLLERGGLITDERDERSAHILNPAVGR
jgi:hypothetical protein